MTIILIGNRIEILLSTAQGLEEFDMIVLSSETPFLLKNVIESKNQGFCLMLFDLNNPLGDWKSHIPRLLESFPELEIWALFDSNSKSLQEEVRKLGVSRIITHRDNLKELISDIWLSP